MVRRITAPVLSVLAALLALGPADGVLAAVASSVLAGTLTAASDGSDAITITCGAAPANVRVNGADPGTGPVACGAIQAVVVNGGPGNNSIDVSAVTAAAFPAVTSVTLNGNAGADSITGSPLADAIQGGLGDDIIIAGDGNDVIAGGDGNDTIFGGNGNDQISWSPGDDNDVLEGQGGTDRLVFNASNTSEIVSISPNGGRVVLQRDVASVLIDMDDIEQVELALLGGSDQVAVATLAGTDLNRVSVDLGADGVPDQVRLIGSIVPDLIDAAVESGVVRVNHGLLQLRVAGADPTQDRLQLLGEGDGDSIVVSTSLAGVMAVDVVGGAGNDTVTVRGSAAADAITLAASAPVVRAASADLIASMVEVEALQVETLGGNDTITATGNLAPLFALTIDGGDGDDLIHGGNGNDTLIGGNGNDTIDGNQGNDNVQLGAGNDLAAWDPGDGNDQIDGGGGTDTLRFNASGTNEVIAVSPQGSGLQLTRDVGAVTLDLASIEAIQLHVVGGVDTVALASLSGTSLASLDLYLAGTLGGSSGDGSADTVSYIGTAAADQVSVATAAGGALELQHGTFRLRLHQAESALDRLDIALLGGNDTLALNAAAAQVLPLRYDGGDGSALPGGDRFVFTADPVGETYALATAPGGVAFRRTAPPTLEVLLARVERAEINLGDGADSITTALHPGLLQQLNGGAPATIPGDALNVIGFSGDVTVSPILGDAQASIVHAGFEQSSNQLVIEAVLSGAQVVPPFATPASGRGRVTFNPQQTGIVAYLEYAGLLGNSTQVHLHGPAPRHVVAPLLEALPVSGTGSGAFTTASIPLTPAEVAQVKAGLWYFDVHSSASAGGELRGQIDGRLFIDGFE